MHYAWRFVTLCKPAPYRNSLTYLLTYLRNDHISRRKNFSNSAINKGYIAWFSLRMREMIVFPLPV